MLSRAVEVSHLGYLHKDVCCEFRRYNPLLGDLRVIFTIATTNRRFVADVLDRVLDLLSSFQGMHPQERVVDFHVDYESKEWMVAFNLYLGLAGLFENASTWLNAPDAHDAKVD